jgi:hypothetical protein
VRLHTELVPFLKISDWPASSDALQIHREKRRQEAFMTKNIGIAVRVAGGMVFMMSGGAAHTTAAESPRWQVTAEWHRLLRKSVRGTWLFEVYGVEIRSAKFHERWGCVDIRSFGLAAFGSC